MKIKHTPSYLRNGWGMRGVGMCCGGVLQKCQVECCVPILVTCPYVGIAVHQELNNTAVTLVRVQKSKLNLMSSKMKLIVNSVFIQCSQAEK